MIVRLDITISTVDTIALSLVGSLMRMDSLMETFLVTTFTFTVETILKQSCKQQG